jgi:enolase
VTVPNGGLHAANALTSQESIVAARGTSEAPARGEHVATSNRLLAIAAETLPMPFWLPKEARRWLR